MKRRGRNEVCIAFVNLGTPPPPRPSLPDSRSLAGAESVPVTGTPPGALFGPGSEIDSFWISGRQQQARAPAVTSKTFIDSDSKESSLSFVFCILFVFSL